MSAPERWIITGAGGGLGMSMLRQLASDPSKPLVLALTVRKETHFVVYEELSEALKAGRLQLHSCDLSQPFDPETIPFPWASEEERQSVFIVHNAGLLEKNTPGLWNEASARSMFEVNFWAPLRLTYAWLPRLAAGSHIVNIGSMGGYQGSAKFPGLAHYSASKAALACWSECLAAELAPLGIRVNCLALGSADTHMLRTAFPGYESPVKPDAMAAFILNFTRTAHAVINGKVIPVAVTTP